MASHTPVGSEQVPSYPGAGLLVKAGDKPVRLERSSEQEVSSLPLCTESGYMNPAKTSLTEKNKCICL